MKDRRLSISRLSIYCAPQDDAPRLATGALCDEVPDPSGDAIKAKDAHAISAVWRR